VLLNREDVESAVGRYLVRGQHIFWMAGTRKDSWKPRQELCGGHLYASGRHKTEGFSSPCGKQCEDGKCHIYSHSNWHRPCHRPAQLCTTRVRQASFSRIIVVAWLAHRFAGLFCGNPSGGGSLRTISPGECCSQRRWAAKGVSAALTNTCARRQQLAHAAEGCLVSAIFFLLLA
jgi:hypothetical protein